MVPPRLLRLAVNQPEGVEVVETFILEGAGVVQPETTHRHPHLAEVIALMIITKQHIGE